MSEPTCATDAIDKLPLYDLIAGIVVALERRSFTDQALLSALYDFQLTSEFLKRRLNIRGIKGAFCSKSIASTLSFMEMYRVLEPSNEPSSITAYRCLPAMRETLQRQLNERHYLPKHEKTFAQLACGIAAYHA